MHQDVHWLMTIRRYPELKCHTYLEAKGLQPAHAPQGSLSSPHSRYPRHTRITEMWTLGIIIFNIPVKLKQFYLYLDSCQQIPDARLKQNRKQNPIVNQLWVTCAVVCTCKARRVHIAWRQWPLGLCRDTNAQVTHRLIGMRKAAKIFRIHKIQNLKIMK